MSDDRGYIYFENESGSHVIYLYTSPGLGWKLAIIVPSQMINEEIRGPIFAALLGLFLALAALIAALGVFYLGGRLRRVRPEIDTAKAWITSHH